MAEIVLSFVVDQTLERLLSLITPEISLLWNLNDHLKELQDSLTMIRAVLQDAEDQQTKRPPVKLWLNKLKQVAFDAEDLFDTLAYENLRLKIETEPEVRSRNPFSKASRSAEKGYSKFKLAHKVKKVNQSLSKIMSQAMGYGLRSGHSISTIDLNRVTDSVLDSPTVGREADVSRIVNLLGCTSEQQLLTIVPIVGIGGLGKTFVAKLVCQQAMARDLFQVKIWICVSDDSSDQRILGEMLQCLCPNMGGLTNKDAIVSQLQKELEMKKFLLVLDDVWDDAFKWWNDLKTRLLTIVKNSGSAILLTTRKENVASIVETSPHHRHNLDCLTDDQCWSIIKNKVVGNREASIPVDLEKIGRAIATKCKGVPLAAKVLGGTLSSLKLKEEEWLPILNNKVLNASDKKDNVEAILKLSFNHLPSFLKQCFAYCSMFPKDFLIGKEDLIQLWMAEGFVEPCNGDVGGQYFNALVCNSFFQDVERDRYENIVSCKMHDLVHDLAISLSKSEVLLTLENSSVEVDLSCIRRVNLDGEYALNSMAVYARKLRTVFLSEKNVFDESWKLENLRTLKLSGAPIKKLPRRIGEWRNLRYIDVSRTEIKALPKSITKLYSLQTLKFQECRMLKELPRERIKYLVNLKHIEFSWGWHVPSGLGRLTKLERLPLFAVGIRGGDSVEELQCLNELRGELVITNLEKVRDKEEAKKANLKAKNKITALKFQWNQRREEDDEVVLEGLEPNPNIERLEIENYCGKRFPEWVLKMKVASDGDCFTLLNNLVELKLVDCDFCEQVPSLGNLPSLKYLYMRHMWKVRSIGNGFYDIESGGRRLFPSLKRFDLHDMDRLVEWKAPEVDERVEAVFPCLEELSIGVCRDLTKIPMSHLSSLVKLQISCCLMLEYIFDEVQSFPGLKSLGISWSNITHLPMESFTCLEELRISYCHRLESIPEALGELNSLISLEIRRCRGLREFPGEILGRLSGLKKLTVGDFSMELNASLPYLNYIDELSSSLHELTIRYSTVTSLPDQLQKLTSLKFLKIYYFEELEFLPEWLGNLSLLETLIIEDCASLQKLPSAETVKSLSKLTYVEILGCPHLKDNRVELSKISHIHVKVR